MPGFDIGLGLEARGAIYVGLQTHNHSTELLLGAGVKTVAKSASGIVIGVVGKRRVQDARGIAVHAPVSEELDSNSSAEISAVPLRNTDGRGNDIRGNNGRRKVGRASRQMQKLGGKRTHQ